MIVTVFVMKEVSKKSNGSSSSLARVARGHAVKDTTNNNFHYSLTKDTAIRVPPVMKTEIGAWGIFGKIMMAEED